MRGKPLESFDQRGTISDLHSKMTIPENSLAVWWLGLRTFTAVGQSLVEELRSRKSCSAAKKKKRLFQLLRCRWVEGGHGQKREPFGRLFQQSSQEMDGGLDLGSKL